MSTVRSDDADADAEGTPRGPRDKQGAAQGGGSRMVRRRRAVLATAGAAVVLSVGGVVAAQWVQSPSQAAADTRPPKASVITAPVVRQVLHSTVVLRGTFSNGRTVSVSPTSVAATETASQPAQLVVTGVYVRPGRKVRAAEVLVEFSGRPVFALPGALPAYRDLTFGEEGKDVAQLQAALRGLGYRTGGDAKGVFGAGTEAAIRKLYGALGYPVPVSPADPDEGGGDTAGTGAQAKAGQGAEAATAAPDKPATHAMVPSSEVVFMPSLPAHVVSVPVHLGDPVKGPVVTLARGGMTLTGQLDPAQEGLVAPGMKAEVLSEATGATADGTVESVGVVVVPGDGKAGDGGSGGGGADGAAASGLGGGAYLPLVIRPAKAWDNGFAGQDVRITLTAAATDAPVLAVPQAAISARADTRTTVTVVDAGGGQRVVPVKAGVSADGLVQVTPVPGARLAPGDKVVVGQ